ncbi:MAG: hypothetical protein ABI237_05840 [Ginsengibacter sp.]
MKQISFKKIALIICLLCAAMILLTVSAFAQDTIRTNRVRVRNTIGINKKTGRIVYASPRHWEKVKDGYIIKEANGMYILNGREVFPSDYPRHQETMIAKK